MIVTETQIQSMIEEGIHQAFSNAKYFNEKIQKAEYELRKNTAELEVQTRDGMIYDNKSYHEIMERIEEVFDKEVKNFTCMYDDFARKNQNILSIIQDANTQLEDFEQENHNSANHNLILTGRQILNSLINISTNSRAETESVFLEILHGINDSYEKITDDVNKCYQPREDIMYGVVIEKRVEALSAMVKYGQDSQEYKNAQEMVKQAQERKLEREDIHKDDVSDKKKLCESLREMYKAKDALIESTHNIVFDNVKNRSEVIQEMNEMSIQIQKAIMQTQENIYMQNKEKMEAEKDVNADLSW